MNKGFAFFIDVDNTLLNNDHIKDEIKKSLIRVLGEREALDFWRHHDDLKTKEQIVNFPKIIRSFCMEKDPATCEVKVSRIFNNIEFQHALYPKAIEVLRHLKSMGELSLFTEGEKLYQNQKIEKAGLVGAVDNIYLFEDKINHLAEVLKDYRNLKKIFIDDRAKKLEEIKEFDSNIYTIEVLQGHYSNVDHIVHKVADKQVKSISELLNFTI